MKIQVFFDHPLVKKLLGLGLVKILAIPLSLVVSVILARTLGVREFGVYTFLMALVPILALPVSGGLTMLLTREVAYYRHTENWDLLKGIRIAAQCWVLLVSLGVCICYLLLFFFGYIPDEPRWRLLPWIIIMVPIFGLNAIREGVFRGIKEPLWALIPSQLIQPIVVLFCVGVIFFWGRVSKENVLAAQVLALLVVFLLSTMVLSSKGGHNEKCARATFRSKQWFSSLLPFSLINIVNVLNSSIGIVLLGVMGDGEAVAAMRVADKGAQFINLPLMLISMVMAPYIVSAWGEKDNKKMQRLASYSSRVAFIGAFPLSLLFLFFGEEIVGALFGVEYGTVAYFPLVVLAGGQLFNVFFGAAGLFLSMTGNERFTLRGQLLSLMVSFFSCLLLIPGYGVKGAAIGVTCGLIVWNMSMFFMLYRQTGVRSWAL